MSRPLSPFSGLRLPASLCLPRHRAAPGGHARHRRPSEPGAGRRVRAGSARRALPEHGHVGVGLRCVDGQEEVIDHGFFIFHA